MREPEDRTEDSLPSPSPHSSLTKNIRNKTPVARILREAEGRQSALRIQSLPPRTLSPLFPIPPSTATRFELNGSAHVSPGVSLLLELAKSASRLPSPTLATSPRTSICTERQSHGCRLPPAKIRGRFRRRASSTMSQTRRLFEPMSWQTEQIHKRIVSDKGLNQQKPAQAKPSV